MAGRGRCGRAARSRLRRHVAEDVDPEGRTSTQTVTATVTAPAATPADTGYLDPATLAQALVAGYNRVQPLSDHAISGTCVVDQTTDSATCTLTTNRGRVVEPVGIAGDGSSYQAGPGMG